MAPIRGQSLTGFIFVNDRGGPGSRALLPAQAQGVTGRREAALLAKRWGGGTLSPCLFPPRISLKDPTLQPTQ